MVGVRERKMERGEREEKEGERDKRLHSPFDTRAYTRLYWGM